MMSPDVAVFALGFDNFVYIVNGANDGFAFLEQK